MSEFKVPLTTITEITEHTNAHSLEVAHVYGFQVVVKKDSYKAGDEVIYIPIDSLLPQPLEDHLFPPDSKIKLHHHRVKQIRIRKLASQGMLIHPDDIKEVFGFMPCKQERDYQKELKVVKYEPPAPSFQKGKRKGGRKLENPKFHKYQGLDNIKWFPTLFKPEDEVVIQEKIHGTNARASIAPFAVNTLWRKIKGIFRLNPKYELCYGSNNVQLQYQKGAAGYYAEDIYGNVFGKLNVHKKLQPGETVFGEIYGEGIQKNYSYGTREHKFILFDVKKTLDDGTQRWLNPEEVKKFAKERGFDMVPELYRGSFSMEKAKELTLGPSVLAPSQKVREGVVVKSLFGYHKNDGGKKALKVISEKYLDKDQSDFH